jgi:hypothetical protein
MSRKEASAWFCGFVVLWFCGFVVLWFCGFVVLWFVVCGVRGFGREFHRSRGKHLPSAFVKR